MKEETMNPRQESEFEKLRKKYGVPKQVHIDKKPKVC